MTSRLQRLPAALKQYGSWGALILYLAYAPAKSDATLYETAAEAAKAYVERRAA